MPNRIFLLSLVLFSFSVSAKFSLISVFGAGEFGCIGNDKKVHCFGRLPNLPKKLSYENIKNIQGGYRHLCVHHADQVNCFARNGGNPNTKIPSQVRNIKK